MFINVRTKKENDELMAYYLKQRQFCYTGELPTECNFWDKYKEKTVYDNDSFKRSFGNYCSTDFCRHLHEDSGFITLDDFFDRMKYKDKSDPKDIWKKRNEQVFDGGVLNILINKIITDEQIHYNVFFKKETNRKELYRVLEDIINLKE